MKHIFVALMAIFVSASFARAEDKVVNIYNWADYIDPNVLEQFTRETGIRVVYDTFDSNEVLETKLLAGRTGYDVVVPSGPFLQRQIRAGVYQKLDKSRLPNMKGLWPDIMARLAVYDPGNRYAVNYMWYTTGIAYNVAKAKEILGNRPLDSWDIVFNSYYLRKFSDCGVYVLDSPVELFAVALRYIGLNPNSKNPADIRRAANLLARMRPYVKRFDSSGYISALANGDICLAVAPSGGSLQARDRARESDNGIDINYVIPKEGTLMSLDNLAIPRDAPHVGAALQLINFLMRPEIAARDTNATKFANGVVASIPYIDRDILDNKSIYPDGDVLKRLFTITSYDAPIEKFIAREWIRVKRSK